MSNELVNQNAQLPAHLMESVNKENTGLEDVNQYISPPRLKIVQDKRSDEKYKQFSGGDIVVIPQLEKICDKDGFFIFTPLFIYDEFCIHNPYALRARLPMIRDRTLDPKSEIAEKARRMVTEDCPEDSEHQIKYVTHLNFLVAIHDVSSLKGIEVALSFSLGEFKTATALMGSLRMRCNNGTPIYAHKFQATPGEHKSGSNEWWGLDITNPTADYEGSPWVEDAEMFEHFKSLHENYKANRDLIKTDYTDDSQTEPSNEVTNSDTL